MNRCCSLLSFGHALDDGESGVFGGGEWHRVVGGSTAGMPNNATYSLSASEDGTLLTFTTRKQFNVPPATGTHSMVYTYDTTTGEFGAAVFVANALGLNGTVDGLDYNPPVAPQHLIAIMPDSASRHPAEPATFAGIKREGGRFPFLALVPVTLKTSWWNR